MPVALANGEFFRVVCHRRVVAAKQVRWHMWLGRVSPVVREVGKVPAKGKALAESLVLPQPCGLPSKAKVGKDQGFSRRMVGTVLQGSAAPEGRSSYLSEEASAVLFIPVPIVSTRGARCT